MKSSLELAAALAMASTATSFAPSLTPYSRSNLIWTPGAGANKGKKTAKDKAKAKAAYKSKRRNRK